MGFIGSMSKVSKAFFCDYIKERYFKIIVHKDYIYITCNGSRKLLSRMDDG